MGQGLHTKVAQVRHDTKPPPCSALPCLAPAWAPALPCAALPCPVLLSSVPALLTSPCSGPALAMKPISCPAKTDLACLSLHQVTASVPGRLSHKVMYSHTDLANQIHMFEHLPRPVTTLQPKVSGCFCLGMAINPVLQLTQCGPKPTVVHSIPSRSRHIIQKSRLIDLDQIDP